MKGFVFLLREMVVSNNRLTRPVNLSCGNIVETPFPMTFPSFPQESTGTNVSRIKGALNHTHPHIHIHMDRGHKPPHGLFPHSSSALVFRRPFQTFNEPPRGLLVS
jgi:hypothetical protein